MNIRRSKAKKRHLDLQEQHENREYRARRTRACTVEPYKFNFGQPRSPRRVTFVEQPGQLKDNIDEFICKAIMPPPSSEIDNAKQEWGVDGDVTSHPSIEHRERFTWKLAPSRVLIRPTEERYRVSYDMDLLPFQAGVDAFSEEEEDYLYVGFDGELIDGVKLKLPEEADDQINNTTDDRPVEAHSTNETYTASLAVQQGSNVRARESELRKTHNRKPLVTLEKILVL